MCDISTESFQLKSEGSPSLDDLMVALQSRFSKNSHHTHFKAYRQNPKTGGPDEFTVSGKVTQITYLDAYRVGVKMEAIRPDGTPRPEATISIRLNITNGSGTLEWVWNPAYSERSI